MSEAPWYQQTLYEQSWENYRNEDENYRTHLTNYLVFTATLVYVASQARAATRVLATIGALVSLVTILYVGRVGLYSWRWLQAKAAAIGAELEREEIAHLGTALKQAGPLGLLSSRLPGHLTAVLYEVAGLAFFSWMAWVGPTFWGK